MRDPYFFFFRETCSIYLLCCYFFIFPWEMNNRQHFTKPFVTSPSLIHVHIEMFYLNVNKYPCSEQQAQSENLTRVWVQMCACACVTLFYVCKQALCVHMKSSRKKIIHHPASHFECSIKCLYYLLFHSVFIF